MNILWFIQRSYSIYSRRAVTLDEASFGPSLGLVAGWLGSVLLAIYLESLLTNLM